MTNPDVGKIFEVGINDVGYMLFDWTEEEQYRRMVSRLEPDRFASGETPVSESFDRYSFFNSSEWRGGAGQKFLNRQSSDKSSFWDSAGVDPFNEDQRLQLLPDVDQKAAVGSTNPLAVAGQEYLCVVSGAFLWQYTLAGDTATQGDFVGASGTVDLAMANGFCYQAQGTQLNSVELGTATGAIVSTLDVVRVDWIGDRFAVIYRDSATNTWRFSTLDNGGTEEIGGGLLTLPGADNADESLCQTKIGGITHGINYVWFSKWSQDGDEAHIYVWNIDTTLSPYIALQMPAGEIPLDLFFYQGGLYIYSVGINTGGVKIYRCIVNGDGTLTPFVITTDEQAGEIPATLLYKGNKFAADGRKLFFAWNGMEATGEGGFGVIDLAGGGYAKRGAPGVTGETQCVYVWGGRPGCSIDNNQGIYLEHSTDKRLSGWLKTSISDADSALDKRWTNVSWDADVDDTFHNISIAYTTDGGETYTNVVTATTDDQGVADVGVDSPSLGVQISLGTIAGTPTVRVVSTKFHPLGISDEMLVLPIDCSDRVEGLNGADLGYTPNSGRARARTLSELQGNYVTIQDIDWPETATTDEFELIQVDVRRVRMARDPSTASNRSSQVAVCTFRRDLSVTAATAPAANTGPVVDDPGTQNDSVDVAITAVQLTATDADSDALTWGCSGLPTGLVCDQNGRITGTPTETGAFSVTAYASDQVATDDQAFTWNIT